MDFKATYRFRRHPEAEDCTTLTDLSVALNGTVQFKAASSDGEVFLGSMPVSEFECLIELGVIEPEPSPPASAAFDPTGEPVTKRSTPDGRVHLASQHEHSPMCGVGYSVPADPSVPVTCEDCRAEGRARVAGILAALGYRFPDSELQLHLISAHAFGGFSSDPHADHEHEHNGPGTIRNHDRSDRSWDPDKVIAVLAEAYEG